MLVMYFNQLHLHTTVFVPFPDLGRVSESKILNKTSNKYTFWMFTEISNLNILLFFWLLQTLWKVFFEIRPPGLTYEAPPQPMTRGDKRGNDQSARPRSTTGAAVTIHWATNPAGGDDLPRNSNNNINGSDCCNHKQQLFNGCNNNV